MLCRQGPAIWKLVAECRTSTKTVLLMASSVSVWALSCHSHTSTSFQVLPFLTWIFPHKAGCLTIKKSLRLLCCLMGSFVWVPIVAEEDTWSLLKRAINMIKHLGNTQSQSWGFHLCRGIWTLLNAGDWANEGLGFVVVWHQNTELSAVTRFFCNCFLKYALHLGFSIKHRDA